MTASDDSSREGESADGRVQSDDRAEAIEAYSIENEITVEVPVPPEVLREARERLERRRELAERFGEFSGESDLVDFLHDHVADVVFVLPDGSRL